MCIMKSGHMGCSVQCSVCSMKCTGSGAGSGADAGVLCSVQCVSPNTGEHLAVQIICKILFF